MAGTGAPSPGSAPSLALVWAQTPEGVIGQAGSIPWHVPEDLARFRALTTGHVVVMGRATWESLPARARPLPGRDNIVLSRTPGYTAPGATVVSSLGAALTVAGGRDTWVIGGAAVYAATIDSADRVEVTEVGLSVPGDAHAPRLGTDGWEVRRQPETGWFTSARGTPYRFRSYRRARSADPAAMSPVGAPGSGRPAPRR